jgi:multidrug efflux pump subunit AcrA (membrane-fusion protein)
MRKYKLLTFIVASMAITLSSCNETKGIEENPEQLDFTKVDYFVCQQQDLPNIVSIPGKTAPFERIDVYPEISGVVQQIHFKEGEAIQQGALLISIDTDVEEAEREQLKVDLRLAERTIAGK